MLSRVIIQGDQIMRIHGQQLVQPSEKKYKAPSGDLREYRKSKGYEESSTHTVKSVWRKRPPYRHFNTYHRSRFLQDWNLDKLGKSISDRLPLNRTICRKGTKSV